MKTRVVFFTLNENVNDKAFSNPRPCVYPPVFYYVEFDLYLKSITVG
jgi:hypothetical protein